MELTEKANPDRQVTFTISNGNPDSDNDRVAVDGWDLNRFMKNPVFLLSHNQRDLPIGRFTNVWSDDKSLLGTVQFPDKGTYETADIVYDLYKQNVMNAVSAGFRGLEYEPNDIGGNDFSKQQLVEVSAVSIPANEDALALIKSLSKDNEDLIIKEAIQELEVVEEEPKSTPDTTKDDLNETALIEGMNRIIEQLRG
ncbi:MAG: HK97 family phage prohead protease [Candidatus Thorarchaeota archaeon]